MEHTYIQKEDTFMDNTYALMIIQELKKISRALEKIANK